MNDDMNNNTILECKTVDVKDKFKGYSLSELRYQRALTALQREYAKEKTFKKLTRLRKRSVFGGHKSSTGIASTGSWISNIAHGLNFADYAMLGFSLFASGKKVWKFFRRKKK